ncbi:MAG: hypothetical protein LBT84_04710 [Spirochaetia bacterium]|nr:hypothetical protein [Spirochaetia bacterium]
MKKIRLHLIYLLLTAFACSSDSLKERPPFSHFTVSFEQDGLKIQPDGITVHLEKRPFSIVVSFDVPGGVFVNASLSPATMEKTTEGIPARQIEAFSQSAIDEELFNSNERIVISDNRAGFWRYAGENENDFNSSLPQNGVIECRRTVSAISYAESMNETIPVAKLPGENIYLSFMKFDWSSDYSNRIEKKRDCIVIRFLNSK